MMAHKTSFSALIGRQLQCLCAVGARLMVTCPEALNRLLIHRKYALEALGWSLATKLGSAPMSPPVARSSTSGQISLAPTAELASLDRVADGSLLWLAHAADSYFLNLAASN